jgi:hypothetical protein
MVFQDLLNVLMDGINVALQAKLLIGSKGRHKRGFID